MRIHLNDIKVNYRLDYEKRHLYKAILKDREYLERLIYKGEFFIFELLNELDNYNLPSSLALLPILKVIMIHFLYRLVLLDYGN